VVRSDYVSTKLRFELREAMLKTIAKHALVGAFDEKEIRVLVEALDQAWAHLRNSGSALVEDGHAEATRELLALRIIEIAQLGERDPARLRDNALAHLARTSLKSTGL
jgi:hypothetical protein